MGIFPDEIKITKEAKEGFKNLRMTELNKPSGEPQRNDKLNEFQNIFTKLHLSKGIEFLPKGFLELDPILFYDDYVFTTNEERKYFLEV